MISKFKTFYLFLRKTVGKRPICNNRAKSGWFIGSYCFPLCARCTAIIGAILTCRMLISLFTLNLDFDITWATILIIPCFIDGLGQYVFKKESNNKRRLITGFIAGIGLFLISQILKSNLF